jgi:rubrerythrin
MAALTNYRDISTNPGEVGAGFQFEFICESCGDTWKSQFKPYRAGQAAGLFRRFGYIFNEFAKISAVSDIIFKVGRASGTTVEATGDKPRAQALEEAMAIARQRYDQCSSCHTWVCANCYDESRQVCVKCDRSGGAGGGSGQGAASASAMACPNCQTPSQGGRFCHECGFDMASTHKSCPSCGTTLPRQARFCTDCGHGF